MRDLLKAPARVPLRTLLASLVMLLCALSSRAADALEIPGESDEEARQRVEALVRATASERGVLLQSDPNLDEAARRLARQAAEGTGERARSRTTLWEQGIRDFEFLPVTLATRAVPPDHALRPLLSDRGVRWERFNVASVAVHRVDAEVLGLAMVFTRRSVAFGAGERPQDEVVALATGYSAPRLYVTEPTGLVSTRVPQELDGGRHLLDTAPGVLEGGWLFELVADGPTGTEVVALWPRKRLSPRVHEGRAPGGKRERGDVLRLDDREPIREEGSRGGAPPDSAAWVAGAGGGPSRSPRPEDVRAAEDQLWELVQSARRSRGIPRLVRDVGMTRAARTHAGDIARGERFGHVTSSGTAMHRLEAEGVTAVRASENVAVVADVAAAHTAFMASPAHRAAILDPELTHGGLGVVIRKDSSGRWSAAVSEVFAIPMDDADPASWEAEAFKSLERRRAELNLRRLARRSRLDGIAREAAARLVDDERTAFTEEERMAIAGEIRFHFHNARRIGVDLVVGTDVTAVDRLTHAIEQDLVEVGIGVVRSSVPLGRHRAGSLVVALLFVQR